MSLRRQALIAGFTGLLGSLSLAQQPVAAEPPAGTITAELQPPTVVEQIEAVYPQNALAQGLTATVRMAVTVDAEGRVGEVQVLEPVGHGFDEAATEALRHFRFAPAILDGKPVAVQIEYTYHFVLQQEPGVEDLAPDADLPLHTLTGLVLEKGTRQPLASAQIRVIGPELDLETDTKGRFTCRVPAGRHHLIVAADGHQSAELDVAVTGTHLTNVEVYLPSNVDERYRTVVRERRDDRAEEPVIRLSQQEVRRIPGTFGDPVRVLQTLPGVARPRALEGDVVVRGSEPGNTPLYLGGFPVPFLFHFGVLESVIDPAFIDRIDFFPGAVPLRYGNAAQGVVDVRSGEGKAERFSASADVGITHSAGAATVPLFDDKLRLDLGGRYSYLGLTLPALLAPASFLGSQGEVVLSVLPAFWDYNVRVSGGPPSLRAYANVFGAHDGVTIDIVLVRDILEQLMRAQGRQNEELPSHLTIYDQTFHHLVTGATARLDRGLELELALLLGTRTNLNILGLGGAGDVAALMRQDTQVGALRLEARIPAARWLALRVGLDSEVRDESIGPTDELVFLDELLPSDHDVPYGLGFYVAAEGKPWPGGRITTGARLQADRQHRQDFVRADPRIIVEQDAALGVTARAAYSHQTQLPDYVKTSAALGAESLPLTVSDQAMGGVQVQLPWELEAGVSLYVSRMEGLALQEPGWETRINEQTGEASIEPLIRYIPSRGHAYGMELSLRRRPKGRFFGWISYSVSRSLRSTRDLPSFVGDYDQPHHLVAVAAYKLGWGFEVSARFRLASGNPYTPFIGAFDVDTREYQQVRGTHNAARDALYHQLDVRVDKTFTFDLFKVGLYLDIYNAYVAPNPLPLAETHLYSYDTFDVTSIGSFPIIPFFGLSAEF
ncbi:MAG: TonB family protein [Pseudomonadota bacterium]